MTSRKKPGVAFWATVALVVVLVSYLLSFGPICRVIERRFYQQDVPMLPDWAWHMYSPLGSLACNGPKFARVPFVWYLSLWTNRDDIFPVPRIGVGIGLAYRHHP